MIKYYCDFCQKEIEQNNDNMLIEIALKEYKFMKSGATPQFKITKEMGCKECTKKFKEFRDQLCK